MYLPFIRSVSGIGFCSPSITIMPPSETSISAQPIFSSYQELSYGIGYFSFIVINMDITPPVFFLSSVLQQSQVEFDSMHEKSESKKGSLIGVK